MVHIWSKAVYRLYSSAKMSNPTLELAQYRPKNYNTKEEVQPLVLLVKRENQARLGFLHWLMNISSTAISNANEGENRVREWIPRPEKH